MRQKGHWSSHTCIHQLCSPACCPTMALWLQNSSLFLAFFAYFCHLCGFAQGSTGFSESQLYLFIESTAILNIINQVQNTDTYCVICGSPPKNLAEEVFNYPASLRVYFDWNIYYAKPKPGGDLYSAHTLEELLWWDYVRKMSNI